MNRLKNEPWVAAVWPLLPEGKPIDHPDLAPLWDVMNDAHLPIFFHSFFYEPPYFPGYRDIWGNAVVARTAAHPWGAARLLSYLIVGQIFDKYPNIKRFGWQRTSTESWFLTRRESRFCSMASEACPIVIACATAISIP